MHSPFYRSNTKAVFPVEKDVRPGILCGWKEIANYLHMSVRTVQRNEDKLGIPIRRPISKSSKGPVITTTAELDGWIKAIPVKAAFQESDGTCCEFRLNEPFERTSLLLYDFCQNIKKMTSLHQEMTSLRQETSQVKLKLRESLKLMRENLRGRNPEAPPDALQPSPPPPISIMSRRPSRSAVLSGNHQCRVLLHRKSHFQ